MQSRGLICRGLPAFWGVRTEPRLPSLAVPSRPPVQGGLKKRQERCPEKTAYHSLQEGYEDTPTDRCQGLCERAKHVVHTAITLGLIIHRTLKFFPDSQ